MRLGRTVRLVLLVSGGLILLWTAWLAASLLFLPSVAPLKDPRKSYVVVVKDWNRKNRPFVLGPKNRRWTPIGAIPSSMKKAVIAAEDAKFYAHEGVDYDAMKDALKTDIRKRRFARGGSTITQQLAKNLYLSPTKNPLRKLRELLIARRLEAALSKTRILETYLNVMEWGDGIYGAEAASRAYFGKPAAQLSSEEAALLAACIVNPRIMNPEKLTVRLQRRQRLILSRMGAVTPPPDAASTGAAVEAPKAETPAPTRPATKT